MQFGPDGLPISTQTVYVGPPLQGPAPVAAEPTVTVIEPIVYDPTTEAPPEGNVVPTVPYAVAISYQNELVTGKVFDINFVGTGVTVTGGSAQAVVTIDTGTTTTVLGGTGISVSTVDSVATVTNTGIINVAAGTGISVSTVNGTATVTNTSVVNVLAGTGIAVNTVDGNATVQNTFTETVYTGGNVSGTLTPNRNNGTIQKFTLTGSINLALPTNMNAGQSLTLIFTQDSVGGRVLNANASYLFASGFQTLSTSAGAIDMLNIFSDGSAYYTTLTVEYS